MESSFAVNQRGDKQNWSERRKIQNRLAQRRFRTFVSFFLVPEFLLNLLLGDKLKERQQAGSKTGQADNGKDGEKDNQAEPVPYSAESSSTPSQNGTLTPWDSEKSPHMFPGTPPTPKDRIPNTKQGTRDHIPYIYPFNGYPSDLDFYRPGQQFNDIPLNFPVSNSAESRKDCILILTDHRLPYGWKDIFSEPVWAQYASKAEGVNIWPKEKKGVRFKSPEQYYTWKEICNCKKRHVLINIGSLALLANKHAFFRQIVTT
jgi:hypothetical protein